VIKREAGMADYERSGTVGESPSATYAYLADPGHLPEYVATMVQARAMPGDHVHVAADVQGRHEEGDAMFRSDPAARRLEWGGEAGHDYRGWLTVADGEMPGTSVVTIHLATHDEADRAAIIATMDETLANITRALSSEA
jgi:hypothetical protein